MLVYTSHKEVYTMRGEKDTRPCANCGTLLTRLVSQARGKYWYCDAKCQAAHAPAPITQKRSVREARVCPVCSTVFETYPSISQECCSRRCSAIHKPRRPKTGSESPCETCGKPVYAPLYKQEQGVGRFCSTTCWNIAQTKTPVVKNCLNCGKELRLKPSQASIQYCSNDCAAQGRTKRPLDRIHNGKPARKDDKGYVMVYEPTHTNTSFHGWQYEHRLVVEKALGRYLASDEHVHHVNGTKDDNRLDNLQVMDANDHARLSSQDFRDSINRQIEELAEYKRRYGPLKEE